MDYIELSTTLRRHKMCIFTLKDAENLFPEEKIKAIKNNLSRWITKGYFMRLKRDLYELVDKAANLKMPDLYVANRLYEPSYVSLETALSIYGVIPDVAANVTSVTTRPTRVFRNKYGSFFYRACQKRVFAGYHLMMYENFKIYIADTEKALVDFLYYRLRMGRALNFNEERLNKKVLKKIDWKKAAGYARPFNKKTQSTLEKCKEFAGC